MAVALDKFVKQLEDSGIVAPGKLASFVPPKAHPKDAEELARQLVKGDHLTLFQAQHVLQGKAKALILGNYTVLDKIGAGGMGQVFKAEHRRMHRIVAIKMLPPSMTKDAAALARFEREVTAAAKLSHLNIVTAYDADEANGAHFLVMEYVEGKDLSALVKKNGPFPVEKAVNYMLQAARGLEFAHAEGVVHRDIKPANLLLDKKGTVKILDMGLARIDALAGDVDAQAELTGTGAIMGTVDYMAPEQSVSTKNADARADIYSLGCSLHYLLIGKATYGGETVTAKLLAHHHEPIPNLCVLRKDVPEQVNAIFRKMVVKRIENRYQSMAEVVADLQACQGGQAPSFTMQRPIPVTVENIALKAIPATPTHNPKPTKKTSWASAGNDKKKLIYGAVGAAILGLAILAGVVLKLKTKSGTLLVEVNQPDAVVQVLSEEGKVEITRPGEKGMISISVDPGKHRLKVEKNGFQLFAKEFSVESGGRAEITATLIPIQVTTQVDRPNNSWNTAAFQAWMKSVAALPADKQVDAVAKKLQELNPGFDGNVTGYDRKASAQVVNGVVTEIGFATEKVTDISPVRALAGLKVLNCSASKNGTSQLFDLSPLQGMALNSLGFGGTHVSDLLPLAKMPLTSLWASDTEVADLSPLKRTPLRHLNIDHTNVSDLSPLQGMPLSSLECSHTNISDLSPLTGMPLKALWIGATQVADLSPLKGMDLTTLACDGTRVSDLSPLAGMELTMVYITPKNIAQGLDAIRPMKSLKVIAVGGGDHGNLPIDEFLKKFDAGEFGKPSARARLAFNDPAFQAWMQSVAVLPSEKQTEAVARKLVELNPGFDGKCSHKIENDVITEFKFNTYNVADISPIRALGKLKHLDCFGGQGKGKLSDLSPLQGLPLMHLNCGNTEVSDLSPLKEMHLTFLGCGNSPVSDLYSLKEMSLTNFNCAGSQVSDLSSLKGMPLVFLYCGVTKISDLSPLRGMRLTHLSCGDTKVSDLSPLIGMPLVMIDCGFTQVSDLSPLRGMPLTSLSCSTTKVFNLSPLKGMLLTNLSCHSTSVADLSPLQGMPLTELSIGNTKITDLSPLSRMPLTILRCANNPKLSNISPLASIQTLTSLNVQYTNVSPAGVAALQKALPKCKIEWNTPAAQNRPWESPAFQAWMETVAVLPSEKQVEAVAKKLIELNPGFDGKVAGWFGKGRPTIKNGIVTAVGFQKKKVIDLSPLRAFVGLKALYCGEGSYSLSGLDGMALTSLNFDGTRNISDLLPLRGMPLESLSCNRTSVSDVSPLSECKYLRTLNVNRTKVTAAGIAALREALPNCKIEWDDPTKPETPAPVSSGTK